MSNSTSDYASLRSADRINLTGAVPLPAPLAIYLETTNICNFKCIFCPESFENFEEQSGGLFRLSEDNFTHALDEISSFGSIQTLNLYMMGEPFANRNHLSFIKQAKQAHIAKRVIVTSNGSLLKPKIYEELCKSGLDYLRISIYGADEDLHRRNTGSPIKLEQIKTNIAGLKAFRDQHGFKTPFIYAKMIESEVSAHNDTFLKNFSGISDQAMIEPVMNWNDPDEGMLAQIDREQLEKRPNFAKKKECCPFPFYTLVIHSDLRVSVCCVDWDKKTVVGDLKTQTLKEIWNGEALRDFQLKHLQRRRKEIEACTNCTFLHTAPDNMDDLSPDVFMQRSEKQKS